MPALIGLEQYYILVCISPVQYNILSLIGQEQCYIGATVFFLRRPSICEVA